MYQFKNKNWKHYWYNTDKLALGKSTLFNLIANNITKSSGKILLFGEEIEKYDIEFLKNNICLAEQYPSFFNTTLEENISLGRKVDSKQALNLACLPDFQNKLNYILENDGHNLSGGQRQRVSIARVFAKVPKILLLDDITSSLDSETESNIIKNFFNFSKTNNITTIIASAKIKNLINCDEIYVLENGKITNFGTHNNLLKTSTLYKQIYELQNKEV